MYLNLHGLGIYELLFLSNRTISIKNIWRLLGKKGQSVYVLTLVHYIQEHLFWVEASGKRPQILCGT